jgi:hypothetical protein
MAAGVFYHFTSTEVSVALLTFKYLRLLVTDWSIIWMTEVIKILIYHTEAVELNDGLERWLHRRN